MAFMSTNNTTFFETITKLKYKQEQSWITKFAFSWI